MASLSAQELEQKLRALKLKEDALDRQAQQQRRTEERLKQNQDSVAKKERANQLKAQDLIKRERKYQEDCILLDRERRSVEDSKSAIEYSRTRSMTFVLPLLLLAGIVAGYFTYEQMSNKQKHYDQIAKASKNIDKLASILSLTQDEVINKSSALSNKKDELDRTKMMLGELKGTTDQLRRELGSLKNSKNATEAEKESLVASAEIMQTQLEELKQQLEDEYLNIDIIEALVAYQQKTFTQQLRTKQEMILAKDTYLGEQETIRDELASRVVMQGNLMKEQQAMLVKAQDKLTSLEKQLNLLSSQKASLSEENKRLSKELERVTSSQESAQEPAKAGLVANE